jgi:ribosomal protein S18 acetylase RimI-like enzyme
MQVALPPTPRKIAGHAKIYAMEIFIRPAGPADAEEIARVQAISWRATYARQLSAESLARVETAWDARHWQHGLERVDDRAITLVLEAREVGMIGFGAAGRRRMGRDPALQPYEGEIYLLYLLPGFQGHGLGAKLMAALARVLAARGMKSALVWALATNRAAIGFYEHLGGQVLLRARKPFFGEPVEEIALGWGDIAILTGVTRQGRE